MAVIIFLRFLDKMDKLKKALTGRDEAEDEEKGFVAQVGRRDEGLVAKVGRRDKGLAAQVERNGRRICSSGREER